MSTTGCRRWGRHRTRPFLAGSIRRSTQRILVGGARGYDGVTTTGHGTHCSADRSAVDLEGLVLQVEQVDLVRKGTRLPKASASR